MKLWLKLTIAGAVIIISATTLYILPAPLYPLYLIPQIVVAIAVVFCLWKNLQKIVKEYIKAVVAGVSGGLFFSLISEVSTPNANLGITLGHLGLGISILVFFMLLYLAVEEFTEEESD